MYSPGPGSHDALASEMRDHDGDGLAVHEGARRALLPPGVLFEMSFVTYVEIEMPEWARNAVVLTNRTLPAPRWVPCGQCAGSGLVLGSVCGYEMMVACVFCYGGGGHFEP